MENKIPKRYTVLPGKREAREVATMEMPKANQYNYADDETKFYKNDLAEYEQHIASLPVIQLSPSLAERVQEGQVITEGVDFEMNCKCPSCGGDGKETCNNPDHGFIDSMPGDVGRLGCPVCGHHPKKKVNNGKNICNECGGLGVIVPDLFEEFGRETGYDEDPVYIAMPMPPAVPIPAAAKQEEGEGDAAILNDAKASAIVYEWFEKWCKKTKRNGGVLISTSIRELLTDFYKDNLQPTPALVQSFNLEDMYMLASKVANDIVSNRMNGEWNLKTTPKDIADDFIQNGYTRNGQFYKPDAPVQGEGVKIEVTDNYFPVECDTCGWFGSSGDLDGGHQIADTGDYGDTFCPVCGANCEDETDEIIPLSTFPERLQKAYRVVKSYKDCLEKFHWDKMSEQINQQQSAPSYPAEFTEWAIRNYTLYPSNLWAKNNVYGDMYITAQLYTGPYQEYLQSLKK